MNIKKIIFFSVLCCSVSGTSWGMSTPEEMFITKLKEHSFGESLRCVFRVFKLAGSYEEMNTIDNHVKRLEFGLDLLQELMKNTNISERLVLRYFKYLVYEFDRFYSDNEEFAVKKIQDFVDKNPDKKEELGVAIDRVRNGFHCKEVCMEITMLVCFHATLTSIVVLLSQYA